MSVILAVKQRRWMTTLRPRQCALIAVFIALAWLVGDMIGITDPVGSVTGRVFMSDNMRPLEGAEISVFNDDEGSAQYSATTSSDGSFHMTHVKQGTYRISASSNGHSMKAIEVHVDEGRASIVSLAVTRSQPDITVSSHQRVYTTHETVRLPIKGYVNYRVPHNTDTVTMALYKTRLSDVLMNERSASAFEEMNSPDHATQALGASLLDPVSGQKPICTSTATVRLTNADKEDFYYQKLDLGKPGPGLYLCEIKHGDKAASAYVLVTDTAMVVKRAGPQVVAYTVDIISGQPKPGFNVRAFKAGAVVGSGVTDERGVAQFTTEQPSTKRATASKSSESADGEEDGDTQPESQSSSSKVVVVADNGTDEAATNSAFYGDEDHGAYRVHAYTDRPIYRPGQRIAYKAIVRSVVELGRRYTIPAGKGVTVELRDPNGELIQRDNRTVNGFGSVFGDFTLSPEAPTGVYALITKIDGDPYTKDITIASYKKPEFEVKTTIERAHYTEGQEIEATVSARYYFDAPVPNAKVTYTVYGNQIWDNSAYADQTGDPDGYDEPSGAEFNEYGETIAHGELQLDQNGKAVIRFAAKHPGAYELSQPMELTTVVEVTDDSSRQSKGYAKTTLSSSNFRTTIKPEGYLAAPQKPTRVQISVTDYDNKPVANWPVKLDTTYYRRIDGVVEHNPNDSQQLNTDANGMVTVEVVPKFIGTLNLTATVQDANKQAVKATDTIWVADDNGGNLQTEYADLSIVAEHNHYAPGDTARIMLNSHRTGQSALVTIESDRVHQTTVVPITKMSTVIKVPILESYGPNVYLSACYVSHKEFSSSSVALRVKMPKTEINVQVAAVHSAAANRAPNSPYRPGESITYNVTTTDHSGNPVAAEFSLGVVDESIYALREDNPKALRRTFYPFLANSVTTEYSFEAIYLGDADKSEPQIVARKRFPDTAYWKPDLRTDAQGKASVTFALPDNLTTWRATVVAQTLQSTFGRGVGSVVVNKDYFVRLELPRFMTQRDTAQVTAVVHNQTGQQQTALVRLRADGLSVEGGDTKTLNVAANQSSAAVWNVTAGDVQRAKVTVTTWTPRVSGKQQFTDGVELPLPIKPHGREVVNAVAGALTAAYPETEALRMEPSAIPSASQLTVRITPSLPGALFGGLEYLVGFPYGCTEQTMSRFMPDVMVQGNRSVANMLEPADKSQLPAMVRDGLTRLYKLQHESGGWGWWQYDDDDPEMTAYVVDGLTNARRYGVDVSKNVLAKARARLLDMTRNAKAQRRAYLLYALAKSGNADIVQPLRASVKVDALSANSLAYLVLTDRELGARGIDPAVAAAIDRKAVTEDGMLHWNGHQEKFDYFNDDLTATSSMLRAITTINPRDPRIPAIVRWIMSRRTGHYWVDTRDTANVLIAFCEYLSALPAASVETGQVRILVNGKPYRSFQLTPDNLRERELVLRIPASDLRAGKNDVTLQRVGGTSPIYYSVEMRQVVAQENIPAWSGEKLSVKREYTRIETGGHGNGGWKVLPDHGPYQFKVGDRVHIRLVINSPREAGYVLVKDQFPAGFEVSERGEPSSSEDWNYAWSATDARDDHIAFFIRDLPKGKYVVDYYLQVITAGKYHTLPTLVQAMYTPEFKAESAEAIVEVKP